MTPVISGRHRDKPPADGWPLPNYRSIKCFVNFWDVAENGGPTACVPGTHRLPEGPQQTLAKTFNQGGRTAEELAAEGVGLAHTLMPNHFKAAMPAGTAMFFNTSIWHTGMPNTSGQDRRGVIMGWRSSQTSKGVGCGLPRPMLEKLQAAGRLRRPTRRVMGLPDEGLP